MNIKSFVKSTNKQERERIAAIAGTTDDYFQQLAGGHRKPSADLCKRLEIATEGILKREQLRPDIYG